MSRDKSTYKETFNRALMLVRDIGPQNALPTEAELSANWGASRTTVRAVLSRLDEMGVIAWQGRQKTVLRPPRKSDFFSSEETTSTSDKVETLFMDYILGGDLKPGTILREVELMREFGASTSVVRELLIRFSRFGLIEKKPNRHWVLRGFTQSFATELFEVREMFELRAFSSFLDAGVGSPEQLELIKLKEEHLAIVENIDAQYLDFPRLDEKFHRTLLKRLNNRFVGDFFDLVSIIFHYHYRWKKTDELERNLCAAYEHLSVIEALERGELDVAKARFVEHLGQGRRTLMASVQWDTPE